MTIHRRRRRAASILKWALIGGFTAFGGAIALQFMNTGIPDNTILLFGFGLMLLITVGSGSIMAAWLTMRKAWRRPTGVRFKGSYWGTNDLIPLVDTPVFVRYRFRRVDYRDELLRLNPDACERDLGSMKSRERAERALASLQTPEAAAATSSLRQRLRDEYQSPWDTKFNIPLVLAIFSGGTLYALAVGKIRKPGADHSLTIMVVALIILFLSIGTLLRIELARRAMAIVTLAAGILAAGLVAVHFLGVKSVKSPGGLILIAAVLGYSSFSLSCAAARRRCSRWGRFGRESRIQNPESPR